NGGFGAGFALWSYRRPRGGCHANSVGGPHNSGALMMVRLHTRWAGTFAAGLLFALGSPARAQDPVDFQKDIQPIFAERCYSCHGAEKVRGKLRLDLKADAFKTRENPTIVPN